MKEYVVEGRTYRLGGDLTEFQLSMYVHLADWKREHLTEECGYYHHKGRSIPYDVLLPNDMKNDLQPLYRLIVDRVREHQHRFPFKLHQFVGHMASSQVACINLFVPLMMDPPLAAEVLRQINPVLRSIATDCLDGGFRIEFWPGNGRERGPLNDHSARAGTDTDMAIAYRDNQDRLKLWFIEHKLTEKEFTMCGGAKSDGRTKKHRCEPAADVLRNHNLCYYHEAERCRYTYWTITDRHPEVFPPDRLASQATCPFKGGMNQLWRNMLLALAVEMARASAFGEELPAFADGAKQTVLAGIPVGINEDGINKEEFLHKVEICLDLLADYFNDGSNLQRTETIYRLFTCSDLLEKTRLLLKEDLTDLAKSKAWNDLAESDEDVSILAYVALQVEAHRPGTVPGELLEKLSGRVAFSSLNTDSVPPLRGEAVELIEEVESLLKRSTDVEKMIAYQRVRELTASDRVDRQRIDAVRKQIDADTRELRAILSTKQAA